MTIVRPAALALFAAGALLAAGPVLAADTGPDTAMATAPAAVDSSATTAAAAPAPASSSAVADQIDAYLKSSPSLVLPRDGAMGVTSSAEPRKVHGEVSVAVGTGGYRSAYVRTDLPVGKTGTLSIAVQDSRSNGRYGGLYGGYGGYGGRFGGYGYNHQSLGIGLALGEAARGPERCRVDLDAGQAPMDSYGQRASCLRTPDGPPPGLR